MKYTIAVSMFLAAYQAIKVDRRHHQNNHNGDKKPKGKKYEPEWGHNSGNSYNNGPTDHFYYGKASPYNVNMDDGLDVQTNQTVKYEPEWGHNSGNSYDNGPFTHFYHGKASPYNVNKDDGLDVQVGEKIAYEPEWGHNSGNSYDNGPFTHFYHGKASP